MDIILLVALGALLIFFMFNSRKKQKARMQEISDNLAPGAQVMTSFGLYGTVLSVDQEKMEVTLESGPGTVLRVHRQAIGQVQAPDSVGAGEATAAGLADPVAGTGSAGPVIEDDEAAANRITDAELDAMNQAKREQETGTDAGEPNAEANGDAADPEDPSTPDDKR